MIDYCGALLFSADGPWLEKKFGTFKGVGLRSVLAAHSLDSIEPMLSRRPITYCVFDDKLGYEILSGLVQTIRSITSNNLRFAPLILFCSKTLGNDAGKLGQLLFDDVLESETTKRALAKRLAKHLGIRVAYFETDDFFGPDREENDPRTSRRLRVNLKADQYNKYTVVRDPHLGIRVEQVFEFKTLNFLPDDADDLEPELILEGKEIDTVETKHPSLQSTTHQAKNE